jgi:acetyl esterase/lipase
VAAERRPTVHPYGPHRDQFLELTLPEPEREAPVPVVVVLHGGFWRAAYGVELARPLAADLAAAGFAAAAVEYRRVGAGGGWPATVEDVAAAVDSLADLPEAARLDLEDVAVVGHSAGGHLAAWTAARQLLPADAPGASPRIRMTAAVLQAGVLDLDLAADQNLGGGAVRAFLGAGPREAPERYALADPVRLLPTGAEVLCLHGSADAAVPLQQSVRYAEAAAAAGDRVEVRTGPGDHMVLIDPSGPEWELARSWLVARRDRRSADLP